MDNILLADSDIDTYLRKSVWTNKEKFAFWGSQIVSEKYKEEIQLDRR